MAPTHPSASERADTHENGHDHGQGWNTGKPHWQSWVLRLVMLGIFAYKLFIGHTGGAIVAAEGVVLSLLPLALERLSHRHVPKLLDIAFTLAIVLQFGSEAFKLFELFTYWDKLVHTSEIFLASVVFIFLVLGYQDLRKTNVPDEFSAATGMLFGAALGGFWEIVEFAFDWFGNANLQKSNADSMTDLLLNGFGAIFGSLLAMRLYRHVANDHVREEFGHIAVWLTESLSSLLGKHGRLIGILVALLAAAIVAAGFLMDRQGLPPIPGSAGASASYALAQSSDAIAPMDGMWSPDANGTCLHNPPNIWPGGEEPGLVQLGPGSAYALDGAPLTLTARYATQRPALGRGTTMDVGLAFGIRDKDNFYVARVSALHDTVVIDRYINGKKRDLHEQRYRTRGDEQHELTLRLRGSTATVLLDGKETLSDSSLEETAGGIGLWARATETACFSEARVDVAA